MTFFLQLPTTTRVRVSISTVITTTHRIMPRTNLDQPKKWISISMRKKSADRIALITLLSCSPNEMRRQIAASWKHGSSGNRSPNCRSKSLSLFLYEDNFSWLFNKCFISREREKDEIKEMNRENKAIMMIVV